jgi:hypothetical protein
MDATDDEEQSPTTRVKRRRVLSHEQLLQLALHGGDVDAFKQSQEAAQTGEEQTDEESTDDVLPGLETVSDSDVSGDEGHADDGLTSDGFPVEAVIRRMWDAMTRLPTCKFLDCKLMPIGANPHCVRHGCLMDGCKEANAVRALGYERESYCAPHLGPVFRGDGKCGKPGCDAECPRENAYCKEHKCRIRGCEHMKWDGCPTDYCVYHTCKTAGCYFARSPESPGCIACFRRAMCGWYRDHADATPSPEVARFIAQTLPLAQYLGQRQ